MGNVCPEVEGDDDRRGPELDELDGYLIVVGCVPTVDAAAGVFLKVEQI